MWMMTPYGFYSTVAADKGRVCVRARLKQHLVRLAGRFPEAGIKITSSQRTDYRYRALIRKDAWVMVCEELAREIDYPNFKSKVATVAGNAAYLDMLHEVWELGMAMQRAER